MKKNEIRWRRRKQGKTIEVTQTLETLMVPQGTFKGYNLPEKSTITFTIEALPEDWEALYYRFHDNPELLGSLVFINFVRPVYEDELCSDKVKAEARYKLMHEMRNFCAAALAIVSHWLDVPEDQRSEYILNIVSSFRGREIGDERTIPSRPLASRVVWAMCKRKYHQQMKEIGLAGPKSLHGFRKELVERNNYIEAARYFFRKHGPNLTIEELIDYLP